MRNPSLFPKRFPENALVAELAPGGGPGVGLDRPLRQDPHEQFLLQSRGAGAAEEQAVSPAGPPVGAQQETAASLVRQRVSG